MKYAIGIDSLEDMYVLRAALQTRMGALCTARYSKQPLETLQDMLERLNKLIDAAAQERDQQKTRDAEKAELNFIQRIERLERELSREVTRGECNAREIKEWGKAAVRDVAQLSQDVETLHAQIAVLIERTGVEL